ncbi:energy transduction protein TonB [Campylobacter iguaniorum]|uniref:Energy transduction protein TonB n=1 Tax=Campylobacter iguaniorum TaxID=1244531 RepID=A0A076F9G9_9BACT|nr:energy transducer TonB [Campylobacter iguaniorum]AII14167.1 energy transduction protein TonB [Campylobacter iguaniorum]ALV23906.1 energy transduction protein TonB [Campylobacter iguaniorum]
MQISLSKQEISSNLIAFLLSFLVHLLIIFYIFSPTKMEPKAKSLSLGLEIFKISQEAKTIQSSNEPLNLTPPKPKITPKEQPPKPPTPKKIEPTKQIIKKPKLTKEILEVQPRPQTAQTAHPAQNPDLNLESNSDQNLGSNLSNQKEIITELKSDDELFIKIRQEILKATIYPKMARKNGYGGVVKVGFELDENSIKNLKIISQSGFGLLDNAALNAVLRASKNFPKNGGKFKIALDIAFKIKG